MSAFRWYEWARAVSRDKLPANAKVLALVLAAHADPAGRCYPSQAHLVAESGTSVTTVRRALEALRKAGWLAGDPGHGRKVSRYQLVERDPSQAKGQTHRERTVRPAAPAGSDPPLAVGGTVQGTVQRTEEHAREPEPDDAGAVTADAVLALHAELMGKHSGVRPAITARDRTAARDLAQRLAADDWRDVLDLALRTGLDSERDFHRKRVVTLAGFAPLVGELLGMAEKSETGPPPAGWDEADDDDAPDREWDRDDARQSAAVDAAISAGVEAPPHSWTYQQVRWFHERRGEPCPLTLAEWVDARSGSGAR